jgi:hypothetical protein
VSKFVSVDLDLTNPSWEGFNLDFKRVRIVVMYDKFKNFEKIVENIYGPIISN